jgi:hypothetical protein
VLDGSAAGGLGVLLAFDCRFSEVGSAGTEVLTQQTNRTKDQTITAGRVKRDTRQRTLKNAPKGAKEVAKPREGRDGKNNRGDNGRLPARARASCQPRCESAKSAGAREEANTPDGWRPAQANPVTSKARNRSGTKNTSQANGIRREPIQSRKRTGRTGKDEEAKGKDEQEGDQRHQEEGGPTREETSHQGGRR